MDVIIAQVLIIMSFVDDNVHTHFDHAFNSFGASNVGERCKKYYIPVCCVTQTPKKESTHD